MKKRILALFCVLVLLVMLAIPAFAADYSVGPGGSVSASVPDNGSISVKVSFSASSPYCEVYLPSGDYILTGDFSSIFSVLYGNQPYTTPGSVVNTTRFGFQSNTSGTYSKDFVITSVKLSVTPSFSNPVRVGSYTVVGLIGEQSSARMYPNPSWSASAFAFSSVTAPTGTTVKAHTSSGSVTVGTLANGFSFRSSDYPAADYFFVDNQTTTPASYTVAVSAINFGVSPAFVNPIQPGEYDVTDLIGTQTTNRMYTVRDDPKTFTFSDVTANASTVVSYAIASEGGTISYHNIGTLTEGFTFSSADYPVASFFTVRNTGSSLASYTVTVENDSLEKSQGIAKSIWETCLEMGTSLINWLKTPANWIALLPLVMFIAVGVVLIICKLVKGV